MSKNYNNEILNDCSWFAEKHRGKNKQSGAHWSTIIRFTKLFDEAVRLQAENEKLKEALREIAEDSNYREDSDIGFHIDNAYEIMNELKEKAQQALNEVKE